jgi:hypothetical protein
MKFEFTVFITDGSYSLPRLLTCNLLLYYFCLFISSLSKIASLMPPGVLFPESGCKGTTIFRTAKYFRGKKSTKYSFSAFLVLNQVHLLIYIIGYGQAGASPPHPKDLTHGSRRIVRTFYRKAREASGTQKETRRKAKTFSP